MGQQRPALLSAKREEGKAGRELGMEVVELDPRADVEEAMPRGRSGPSPDSTSSGFGGGDRTLAGRRCRRRREVESLNHGWWVGASPRRLDPDDLQGDETRRRRRRACEAIEDDAGLDLQPTPDIAFFFFLRDTPDIAQERADVHATTTPTEQPTPLTAAR